jgi:Putative bacterial sensory transduction regulator
MSNILRMVPDTPAAVIAEDEVTLSRLASLLEAAVIEFKIDGDGDLYATDGLEFPTWIQLIEDKKLIIFFTYIRTDDAEETDTQARAREDDLAWVNTMNKKILAVQFYWDEPAVWGQYAMTYDGGLNVRQFIKMLRRFAGAFTAGLALERKAAHCHHGCETG